jgi:hypothetical protein
MEIGLKLVMECEFEMSECLLNKFCSGGISWGIYTIFREITFHELEGNGPWMLFLFSMIGRS